MFENDKIERTSNIDVSFCKHFLDERPDTGVCLRSSTNHKHRDALSLIEITVCKVELALMNYSTMSILLNGQAIIKSDLLILNCLII